MKKFKLRLGGPLPSFANLGYADVACASYAEFRRLKKTGEVRPDMRSQVSLPTAANVLWVLVAEDDLSAVEPLYEAALLREVDRIKTQIPNEELALQWDTPFEVRVWKGSGSSGWPGSRFKPWFGDLKDGILERLIRAGNRVPSRVELGFHFCFGDYAHLPPGAMQHECACSRM